MMGKRDPAQIYHELLDYRWYQAQREHRDVPLLEAAQGYIRDVLANLPDEAMISMGPGVRTLANPYDPSLGFQDDPLSEQLPPVIDPWEAEADQIDPAEASHFDIDALRARAKDNPA